MTPARDFKFDARFYARQFLYLARKPYKGYQVLSVLRSPRLWVYYYTLVDSVSEYKFRSFLANNQSSLRNLDKWARRRMVLGWIHCLINTLGF